MSEEESGPQYFVFDTADDFNRHLIAHGWEESRIASGSFLEAKWMHHLLVKTSQGWAPVAPLSSVLED